MKTPHNVAGVGIGRIIAMHKYPDHRQALALLERAASHVKPLMKKRGWSVGVLEEFYPANKMLLGLNRNRGQRISVRLRSSDNSASMIDFDSVVGTLLHELTHIVHGPHNEQFYRMLDELQREYDQLIASGYSGEGFHSKGVKLGQGVSHNVFAHVSRQQAATAAEKRAQLNRMMTPGGCKLGGSSMEQHMNGADMRALAAERRMRDSFCCGNTTKQEHQETVDTLEQRESNYNVDEVIDISDEKVKSELLSHQDTGMTQSRIIIILDDDVNYNENERLLISKKEEDEDEIIGIDVIKDPVKDTNQTRTVNMKDMPSHSNSQITQPSVDYWTCIICTFTNSTLLPYCEMCNQEQPQL